MTILGTALAFSLLATLAQLGAVYDATWLSDCGSRRGPKTQKARPILWRGAGLSQAVGLGGTTGEIYPSSICLVNRRIPGLGGNNLAIMVRVFVQPSQRLADQLIAPLVAVILEGENRRRAKRPGDLPGRIGN